MDLFLQMWSLELKSQTLGKRIQHDIVGPGSIHAMALSSWKSPGMTSRQGCCMCMWCVCVFTVTGQYTGSTHRSRQSQRQFYRVSDFQNHQRATYCWIVHEAFMTTEIVRSNLTWIILAWIINFHLPIIPVSLIIFPPKIVQICTWYNPTQ